MTRSTIPNFNVSEYGAGLEGAVNYINVNMNYLFVPTFLMVVYVLALYVWTKNSEKIGGGVAFISLVLFIVAIIFQTATAFSQFSIFVFFIGILAGVIIRFIED